MDGKSMIILCTFLITSLIWLLIERASARFWKAKAFQVLEDYERNYRELLDTITKE